MPTASTNVMYYLGCYGKTIRIGVQDSLWLRSFLSALLMLKSKRTTEIDFALLPNTTFSCISSLRIVLGRDNGLESSINAGLGHSPSFTWCIDSEKLIYIVTSIIRFVKKNEPGHHYYFEQDGHIVEFSYLEKFSP